MAQPAVSGARRGTRTSRIEVLIARVGAYPFVAGSALAVAVPAIASSGLPVAVLGPRDSGRGWLAATIHRHAGATTPLEQPPAPDLRASLRWLAAGRPVLLDNVEQLGITLQRALAELLDAEGVGRLYLTIDPGGAGVHRSLLDRVLQVPVRPLALRPELPDIVAAFQRLYGGGTTSQHPVSAAWLARLVSLGWPPSLSAVDRLCASATHEHRPGAAMHEELARFLGARAGAGVLAAKARATAALSRGQVVSLKAVRRRVVTEAERTWLRRALQESGGNRRQAASLLQISYRALQDKIRALAAVSEPFRPEQL